MSYGQPPGYGPHGYGPHGYGPPGYPPPGYPPPKKKSNTTTWVLIGCGAFAMLVLVGASSGKKTSTSAGEAATADSASKPERKPLFGGPSPGESKPEPVETAIPVTAAELFSTYEKNEVAADQLYKDKLLEVSGTIASIDSDFMDDPFVTLQTKNAFQSVQLSGFDKSTAAALSKGQKLTAVCRGAGEVMGTPMLRKCVIR